MQENIIEPRFQTLKEFSSRTQIPIDTLNAKFWVAKQLNIALPSRRRVGKSYVYDAPELRAWLWENAERLNREFHFSRSSESK